jgi:diguanylate cyclase (GGDEF)-like protein
MAREAWLSMEELVSIGVFRRIEPAFVGEEVHITFIEVSGPTRITLEMSRNEWIAVTGPSEISKGIVPSVLADIISALSLNDSSQNVSEKIEGILRLADRVVRGATGHLALYGEFVTPNLRTSERIMKSALSKTKSGGIYAATLSAGDPYLFLKLDRNAGIRSLFKLNEEVSSILLLPLRNGERIYGVIEIHSSLMEKPDSNEMMNFFLLAKGITRLLENNRQLERMVSIDRLTGVNNRNNYEVQLPLEMERATRNRKCLAFLIMDIDDFKLFNDMYGHDIGDKVLKLVSRTVKKHLRKIDLLFRFGGEEFIALLPGAGRDAAERTAERIREVISKTKLVLDSGKELGITITIGGCIYPVDAADEGELFRKADQAMIRAKKEGKNRVSFFSQ